MLRIAWVVGAGLLGRGFLAPTLRAANYLVTFVDLNEEVCRGLSESPSGYPVMFPGRTVWVRLYTARTVHEAVVEVRKGLLPSPDVIFTATGPDADLDFLRGVDAPVLTFENDPDFATLLNTRGIEAYSCIARVTIPDPGGIYAPWHPFLVLGDPWGELQIPQDFVDRYGTWFYGGPYGARVYSDRRLMWDAKRFIHLAPHALLAYLGIAHGVEYIHEAIRNTEISQKLNQAMAPVLIALSEKYPLHDWLAEWQRERARFSEERLPDSVWRVGRNPRVKAAPGERLQQALTLSEGTEGEAIWKAAIGVAESLAEGELEVPEWARGYYM